MARFFVPEFSEETVKFVLSGDDYNHIKVLRLKVGDTIVLCDGKRTDYSCAILDIRPGYCEVEKISYTPTRGEPSVVVRLFVAFSKSDKIELVIQKAVEMGCGEIVVFPSKRCISVPDEKSLDRKLIRWNKISAEAASQSGRGIIPEVSSAPDFKNAIAAALKSDLAVFLYEEERENALKAILSHEGYSSVSLISGPEGGFEPEEAAAAVSAGCQSASLGPRILRCETAPLCALSATMYHTDNF